MYNFRKDGQVFKVVVFKQSPKGSEKMKMSRHTLKPSHSYLNLAMLFINCVTLNAIILGGLMLSIK